MDGEPIGVDPSQARSQMSEHAQSGGATPGPEGPRFGWQGLAVATFFFTRSVVREPRTGSMKEGREKRLLSIVVPQSWQQLTPRCDSIFYGCALAPRNVLSEIVNTAQNE